MITLILVLVAAVGGFVGGILVGRKNAKAVTNVVNTTTKVASTVATAATDVKKAL